MLAHFRSPARYSRWMDERIYEARARLPDEARERDPGTFFGSVQGTLNHLLLADRLWMGRFTGESFVICALDQALHSAFDTLRSARAGEDARIIE